MDVGIRELRDGLSRHLAEVKAGHTITVTDHGKPIARIVPIDEPNILERLVAEGRVRPPTNTTGQRYVPRPERITFEGSVTELLDGERR